LAEDSFTIDLPANSDVSSVALYAEVLGTHGEPLSGIFVTFKLWGDGSLDELTSVHTQQRQCSKQGVSVTWYPFPVQSHRAALKATVNASCPYADSLRLRAGTFLPFNSRFEEETSIAEEHAVEEDSPQVESTGNGQPIEEETSIAEEHAVEEDPPQVESTGNGQPIEVETSTEALSKADRGALFAMLSAGTAKHLGRKPTVLEFIRLCDAVALARKLSIEGGTLPHGTEIHWTGDDWIIDTAESRNRAA
jgi:hypothetical protein